MNFEKVHGKKRKAISPVLATVILIAITLIAAIAIAGFVFGLFGTFTSSATVSASVIQCAYAPAAPGTITCNLTASNSGSSNTALTLSGALHYASSGGSTNIACVTALNSGSLNAGASASITQTCTGGANGNPSPLLAPVSGTAYQGTFGTNNGATVNFAGSFP